MSMIKGIIFDLDGVLVATARYHYDAWKRLAREEFNYNLTLEDNERFKGVSRDACARALCVMAGREKDERELKRLAQRKNEWYLEAVSAMTQNDLLSGSLAFITKCRAHTVKLAVGSASKNAALVLRKTGLAPLLDAVVDGTAVKRTKPDPEVFLKAAETLRCAPFECAVIEDSQVGLQAARSGGMRAVALGNPASLCGYHLIYPDLAHARLNEILNLSKAELD